MKASKVPSRCLVGVSALIVGCFHPPPVPCYACQLIEQVQLLRTPGNSESSSYYALCDSSRLASFLRENNYIHVLSDRIISRSATCTRR